MKKLFDRVEFNGITLKNRFFRSGTWICQANEDGTLKSEFFDYYKKLAQADLGFVVFGYARVDENERANAGMTGLFDDKFISDLKLLTDEFHKNNTGVGIQLAMGGPQIHYRGDINWKILSPSEMLIQKRKDNYENTVYYQANEITVEEIQSVITSFASAALRAKKAGFDMVQLHCGHGYFLSSWMNPNVNKRDDKYGLNQNHRGQFIIELYEAVRKEVGNDVSIGIKINSEEQENDHSNYDNMLYLCEQLDKRGIDLIEVSGCNPSRTKIDVTKESYFSDFSKKLKKRVNSLVVLTGGNKTFSNIEQVLNHTNIDLIGLSRPLIAEIDLVKKWEKDNSYKSICVSCNNCHRNINKCVFDK